MGSKNFKSETEKSHTPSSEYPLYKYTQGFTGEKVFELKQDSEKKPHVIFLFLESFRSQNIGCLGGEYDLTPHFDRLAKEGILYTDFYSNSVRTSRSVVSSLFGIPSDVDGSEAAAQTKTAFIGLPQLLKEAGYQSSYLHSGPIEFEKQDLFFDLHQYDHILGHKVLQKRFPDAESTSWGIPDEYLMKYAASYLEERRERPQFLTLFTITNHHPWTLPLHAKPPKLPSHLSKTYRNFLSTFHYTDACLGLFMELLEKKGLLEDSLLFILGDHGYPMGEHQNFAEQRYLYEENIRVPLLIYGKGRVISPLQHPVPCSQLDLVPTLMDLLDLHGFNLSIGSSLMRQQSRQELELYNPEKDPHEKQNIAQENPEMARQFLRSLKDYERLFRRLYSEKRIVPEIESRMHM